MLLELKWHAGQFSDSRFYFSVFAGEVKQGTVKVSGLVLADASFALRTLTGVQNPATQHTGMKCFVLRSAGPLGKLR